MKLFLALAAGGAALTALPAQAAITLTGAPATGINLSNVRVGDTLKFNFFLGGNQGERLTGNGTYGVSYSVNSLMPISGEFASTGFNDASTNPLAFSYSFTASGAGAALVRGFLSNVGTTSGTQSITANDITFNVAAAVPEPATWALMLVGFGMIGFGMRYGMRRSNAKFDLKMKRIAADLAA